MPFRDELAGLEVRVDGYALQRHELARDGWTRVTTTVVLDGDGEAGEGEDVTYEAAEHDTFPAELMLAGTWSLDDLSRRLDDFELPDYRRWAFESAALDLALRQAGRSLADVVGRPYRPLRFVASTRSDVAPWLENDPALEFKLDATKAGMGRGAWRAVPAALDRVRVVDLKAYYRGTVVDLEPDPVFYRAVADAFPDVVIEDAWLEDGCLEALRGAEARLSFDAPIHSLEDFDALPIEARWLNVKPSRFGTVRKLVECIEACEERGVHMYGGGQYELDHGRVQIQRLASLFYADGPNDVAPTAYNEAGPNPQLPRSPLAPPEGHRVLNLFTDAGRLGDALGATMWGATVSVLEPGEASRYHWHYGEEEWLVVLEGAPTLRTPDAERMLRPWDTAVFPRGEAGAHQLRNDTDRPVRARCSSPPCQTPRSASIRTRAGPVSSPVGRAASL